MLNQSRWEFDRMHLKRAVSHLSLPHDDNARRFHLCFATDDGKRIWPVLRVCVFGTSQICLWMHKNFLRFQHNFTIIRFSTFACLFLEDVERGLSSCPFRLVCPFRKRVYCSGGAVGALSQFEFTHTHTRPAALFPTPSFTNRMICFSVLLCEMCIHVDQLVLIFNIAEFYL